MIIDSYMILCFADSNIKVKTNFAKELIFFNTLITVLIIVFIIFIIYLFIYLFSVLTLQDVYVLDVSQSSTLYRFCHLSKFSLYKINMLQLIFVFFVVLPYL
jgi:hypothetical protein